MITLLSIIIIGSIFYFSIIACKKPLQKAKNRAIILINLRTENEPFKTKIQQDELLKSFITKQEDSQWEFCDEISDFDVETFWSDASSWERFWLEQGPSVFVALGIFFTFFGIITGLWQLDMNAEIKTVQIQIGELVDGLKTAFFSSIVGIACSVIFAFFRSRWTSDADQVTQRLRRQLIQEGKLLTTENLLRRMIRSMDLSQAITMVSRNHLAKLVDKADDLDSKLGTLATDIAENVSKNLGERMDSIVSNKLSVPLHNIQDSFNSFNSGQLASQSDALTTVVQTFVEKLQSELHNHFDELATALRDTWDWYVQTHAVFRSAGELLEEQVSLQKDILEKEQSFFAEMREDLGTLTSHREQLTSVEAGLLQRLTDTLQHARSIEEEAQKTLHSLELTAKHTEEISHQQRNAYEDLLGKSDQLIQQLGNYVGQVQEIGEGFSESLKQLRSDLGEGMTKTFSSFDEGTAQVVDHLNGSFLLLGQSSKQLDDTVLSFNKSLQELRNILQQLPHAIASSVQQIGETTQVQGGKTPAR